MTRRNTWPWILGMIVTCLLVAPFLVRGDQLTRQQFADHSTQIASMTRSERERLDQKFKSFQSLTQEEQDRLRNLHQQIEQDGAQQGNLAQLVKDYGNWLKTIEPYQRERLLESRDEDPETRLALVEEILQMQQTQSAERALRRSSPTGERGPAIFGRGYSPAFNAASLSRIMEEIERRAFAQWKSTPAQIAEVESLTGVERYLAVLRKLKANRLNPEKSLTDDPPQLFLDMLEDLDSLIEDARIRELITRGETPRNQAARLAMMLRLPIQMQFYHQLREAQSRPTRNDLKRFLATLDEREQQALLDVDAANFETDLRNQYVNPDHSGSLEPDQVRRELWEMFASDDPAVLSPFRRSFNDDGRGGYRGGRSGSRGRRPGDRREDGPQSEPKFPPGSSRPRFPPDGEFRERRSERPGFSPPPPRNDQEEGRRQVPGGPSDRPERRRPLPGSELPVNGAPSTQEPVPENSAR